MVVVFDGSIPVSLSIEIYSDVSQYSTIMDIVQIISGGGAFHSVGGNLKHPYRHREKAFFRPTRNEPAADEYSSSRHQVHAMD